MIEPDRLLRQGQVDRQLLAQSLLDHYFAPVHRLALSILADEAEADDVAQETFITALRRLDRYDPQTNLKAWLSTIAVNLSRDRLRRRKARQRWSDLWHGAQRHPGERARDVEDGQLARAATAALWAAVNDLDEKHRLPVILRYANGYAVREIAAVLQVPEGTIHSRLHHACRKLAVALGEPDTTALVMELFND
ncbi:MAG: RNA polymerase sigma factor [Candidatus Promineofilum sp.]|nr:RNA polymerase sigma factor [Promineifilum sp.]